MEYICNRCGGPGLPPHSCPYDEEINDNYDEERCNCCETCMDECRMEI